MSIKASILLLATFAYNVVYGHDIGECLAIKSTRGDILVKIVDKLENGIIVEDVTGQGAFFSYRNLEKNKNLVAQISCAAYDNLRKQKEGSNE